LPRRAHDDRQVRLLLAHLGVLGVLGRVQPARVHHNGVDPELGKKLGRSPVLDTARVKDGVPELDRVPEVPGQPAEEAVETVELPSAEPGRQLQAQGPELGAERRDPLEEPIDVGAGIEEELLVRDPLRELEAEAEVVGNLVAPARHDVDLRERVEGRVALDGVEDAAVPMEKLGGFRSLREQPPDLGLDAPRRTAEVVAPNRHDSTAVDD
jgi:hypothetical protein